tara:strand:- start:1070 stop:1510 length:441 start_codon:yes stop_codon:yes gene_type:complete
MDKLCKVLLYFILFLTLYQYFNKVVEGHEDQSGKVATDCSLNRGTRQLCRAVAPSCFWGNALGKRVNTNDGGICMEGNNPTTDSQEECEGDTKQWKPNSCQPTGSNLTLSSTHSDNNHHSPGPGETPDTAGSDTATPAEGETEGQP